jgi:hypothetical protein
MRLASPSTQASPPSTIYFMNQSPATPSMRQANALPPTADTFAVKQAHPVNSLNNGVRFGLIACGICPICVAGMQAQKELNKIKALREGKDDSEDVKVNVGQGSLGIREAGATTGADVGTKFIGNEDGTRVQRLSAKDYSALLNATLPRIYHNPTDTSYKLVANPHHSSKGVENGLRKQLIQGLEQVTHTETFSEESTPALQEDRLKHLSKAPVALGLYHHIAEGPEVRRTGRTVPLLVGYTSAAKLEKHSLFIPSMREMPGFEELGATPGGMMNMLAMAAKHPELTHVKIAVEPWQHELKKYIDTLKTDYGYDVRNLSHEKAVPSHYRDALHELNMSSGTELYDIPLAPLKAQLEKMPSAKEEPDKGKRDTSLIETIKLPDPEKDLLFERLKKKLEILPRLKDITAFKPFHQVQEELKSDE